MSKLDALHAAAINQANFFARVADFICARTPVGAYREVARDKSLRHALWAPHWPTLREASERDAALFMCFLLACSMLRIDVGRAAAAIRQSTDPQHSMRLFLAERGLLPGSAFEETAPGDVEPPPRAPEAGPQGLPAHGDRP
jgi:hypothetical protein